MKLCERNLTPAEVREANAAYQQARQDEIEAACEAHAKRGRGSFAAQAFWGAVLFGGGTLAALVCAATGLPWWPGLAAVAVGIVVLTWEGRR